jgi:ketosteroid isomerase-like protein
MKIITLTLLSAFVLSAASSASLADKEVLAAMAAYENAMVQKDGAALDKLFSSDLTYVHSSGLFETKADVIKSVTEGKNVVNKIEDLSDTTVRIHGNMAFVTGKEDLWHPTTVVHMHVLHVWEKTPEGWQLVARQATKLK